MNDIREKENEYRTEVAMRAIAHERSAEWHRKRGTILGVAATVISAVMGSSIITAATSHIKDGHIDLPTGFLPSLIYFCLAFGLILAPVLSGIQTYLNDPEQAEKHRITSAGYYRLQRQIDILQLQHSDEKVPDPHRDEALQSFGNIAAQIENLQTHSITLTPRAIERAKNLVVKPVIRTASTPPIAA